MFTTDLVNLYNRNIFKTSLYIYTFQDEKCRLMRNLSLSMSISCYSVSFQFRHFLLLRFCRSQTFCAVNFRDQAIILIHLFNMPCKKHLSSDLKVPRLDLEIKQYPYISSDLCSCIHHIIILENLKNF